MTDTDEFLNLAAKGDLKEIQNVIEQGQDVNAPGEYGRTALMMSAATGSSMEVLETLLDAGANVNHQDEGGWTALMATYFLAQCRMILIVA